MSYIHLKYGAAESIRAKQLIAFGSAQPFFTPGSAGSGTAVIRTPNFT